MTLHNKTNFSILTGYTLALSDAWARAHDQKKQLRKGVIIMVKFHQVNKDRPAHT